METYPVVYFPALDDVNAAALTLKNVVTETPLHRNNNLSQKLGAEIYFKREDLQAVRSYKIRGAYNKMASLSQEELSHGVVCASAGNHAQGVAFSCRQLKVQGTIFMPVTTPAQKVEQVNMFGGHWVKVKLVGDTFDEAKDAALLFCSEQKAGFIHPFDDPKIIEGQATVALEILAEANGPIDYLFVPVGGGGLAAGVSAVFKTLSPQTKVIGVEPTGAPSMSLSIHNNENTTLAQINKFVDGAAVQRVGEYTFDICRYTLDDMVTADEGKVCQVILDLYNKDALVIEPAGALSVAALDSFRDELKGKRVVCIISGSNNDITRMEEIKERALLYRKLKHYFIVKFPQRPGALKEFVNQVLGPQDDITHFEYTKKNSKEKGNAIVGIEVKSPEAYDVLLVNMKARGFYVDYLNEQSHLLNLLV